MVFRMEFLVTRMPFPHTYRCIATLTPNGQLGSVIGHSEPASKSFREFGKFCNAFLMYAHFLSPSLTLLHTLFYLSLASIRRLSSHATILAVAGRHQGLKGKDHSCRNIAKGSARTSKEGTGEEIPTGHTDARTIPCSKSSVSIERLIDAGVK